MVQLTELSLPLEAMRQRHQDLLVERGFPAESLDPADGISELYCQSEGVISFLQVYRKGNGDRWSLK